ncbi:MAG: alpha/beta hydrolase [Maricaulaceae bacterium]
MLKWLLRVVVVVIGVVAITVGASAVMFSLWRADRVRDLEAGSEVVATALGEIEYAVVGEGVPMLVLHGTPGGYDQALVARRAAPERYAGTMTIAVSRPGYLRTPLSSGATFEEQADLFAALLDELGIDRVVVYGASGGGYLGLQFALRHPDRTRGLILYGPEVDYEPLPDDWPGVDVSDALMQDLTMWAVAGPLLGVLGPAFMPELDADDPEQAAMARGLISSQVPFADRAAGIENDVLQRDDPAIDEWPLERISAPTLLLHGNADENSDYEGSVLVASKIPDAELVTFEGGDHFIVITRADEIRAHVDRFIESLQ